MRIHVVDAEPRFRNVIPRDQIVVGVRKIHSVPLVMDGIADNAISLGFPEMNAVSAGGGSHRLVAADFVSLDDTIANSADVNSESVVFDAAIFDCCSRSL